MRVPKPFFRSFDAWWYVQLGQTQHKLAKGKDNEAEAYRVYHRLMAAEGLTPKREPGMKVAVLCDLFLEFSSLHHAPDSYRWYKGFLQPFCDRHGDLEVTALKPFHVHRWLDTQDWGQTTRAAGITCVKRAINWGVGEGYLSDNPLRALKKPRVLRREKVLTADERRTIIRSLRDKPFKMLVYALSQTGCRPGELRAVGAEDCNLDAGVWILKKHKTASRTGKPRIVYLSPPMIALCRRLIAENPSGPLFRNTRGRPWGKSGIRLRFSRLRKQLGLDPRIVAYVLRHTWTTQALAAGLSAPVVAQLLGHTSTAMLDRHYNHLQQEAALLRQAAAKAARVSSVCA